MLALIVWFHTLEAKNERHVIFLVLVGTLLIEAILAGPAADVPVGLLRPRVLHQDFRPPDLVILAALIVRLVHLRGRQLTGLGAAWAAFIFIYLTGTIVGMLNNLPQVDVLYQSKPAFYLVGSIVIATGADVRRIYDSIGGVAMALALLVPVSFVLETANVVISLSTPVQRFVRLGRLSNDTITLFTLVGVVTLLTEVTRPTRRFKVVLAGFVLLLAPVVGRQRASYLVLAAVLIAFALLALGRTWKRRTTATVLEMSLFSIGLIGLVIAGVAVTESPGVVVAPVTDAFGGEAEQRTAQARVQLYDQAIEKIGDSPLIGNGVGTKVIRSAEKSQQGSRSGGSQHLPRPRHAGRPVRRPGLPVRTDLDRHVGDRTVATGSRHGHCSDRHVRATGSPRCDCQEPRRAGVRQVPTVAGARHRRGIGDGRPSHRLRAGGGRELGRHRRHRSDTTLGAGHVNVNDRPIFILGMLQRTGTNHLWDLFGLHPDVFKLEPIFEDHLVKWSSHLVAYADDVSSHWSSDWNVPDEERAALLRSIGHGISDWMAGHSDRRVVTKMPSVDQVTQFFDLFDDCPLVLIVRDGRNVCESGHNSFGWSYERAFHRWTRAADAVLAVRERFGDDPRLSIVRYEDVVDTPVDVMQRLLPATGLDPDRYPFDEIDALPVPRIVHAALRRRGCDPLGAGRQVGGVRSPRPLAVLGRSSPPPIRRRRRRATTRARVLGGRSGR